MNPFNRFSSFRLPVHGRRLLFGVFCFGFSLLMVQAARIAQARMLAAPVAAARFAPAQTNRVINMQGGEAADLNAATLQQMFSALTMPVGGSTELRLTLSNSNSTPLTNASFTNTLTNLSAVGGAVAGTCAGTTPATLAAGATNLSFSGITIPAQGNCTVTFRVTSALPGSHTSTTSGVTTDQTPSGPASNVASLSVFIPPTVTKTFTPANVPLNGVTTLSITVTNPANNPGPLTFVSLTDNYPAGIQGSLNPTNGCSVISLSPSGLILAANSLAAGTSCTVTVGVTATSLGTIVNTTNAVTTRESNPGNPASATLNVFTPPTLSKTFTPAQIPLNGSTTLTFTLANPAANPLSLTDLSFTDNFPAGLVVDDAPAVQNGCGGVFSAAAGTTSVSLSGATLLPNANCSISLKVKGLTAGVKNNTTGNISAAESGAGNTASATLTVVAPPTFSKGFARTLNLTSSFFAYLSNNPAAFNFTSGAHGFAVGHPVTVTGVPVTAYNGTFTIAEILSTTNFAYLITTTGLASSNGGTATSFSNNASVVLGTPTTLGFAITNNNATVGLTGINFTDTLPSGLTVATSGPLAACGGTLTTTAPNTISFTDGALAARSSCNFSVTVNTSRSGALVNTTGAISATESGAGGTATATLTVTCDPSTISNPTTATGTAGTFFSQQFTQTGGYGTTTFSTASPLPSGLALDGASGVLSGTPQQTGTFPIVVNVTDSRGCNSSGATYNLVISCPATAATLPASLPNGTGGTAYTGSVAASPNGTYTYSVGSGLPDGLVLNPSSGAITGIPARTGTFRFTITATRFGSCAVSQPYTVTISCPALVNVLPKPTGLVGGAAFALPSATLNQNYATTISVTPTGGNPTFAVVAAPNLLPAGLSLSPDPLNPDQTRILGVPTVAGTYVFRVQATAFGTCVGSRLYSLKVNAALTQSLAAKAVSNDFDGDGKSDLWEYRAADGRWFIQRSSDGALAVSKLGSANDTAVPADYDGDGQTDLAVYAAADNRWQIRQSTTGALREEQFGTANAPAFPADFDGDGQADLAVRTAASEWQIRRSSDSTTLSFVFGAPEDRVATGDFDGDGQADTAVFSLPTGQVTLRLTRDGQLHQLSTPFAPLADAILLAADVDGDGQDEPALWSAQQATLHFTHSATQQEQQWTIRASVFLLGDYDGDGRAEPAIRQATKAAWQVLFR